ncbi:hypothetical protein EJB05_54540, partial [Eragrostis curvula]
MGPDLLLYLLLVLLFVIPVIVFTTKRPTPRGHDAAGRLPPGPWALPVIGHLHHLAGALPHRALRDLARCHGPLMTLRLGELRAVVASSPAAAREIMKTRDPAFASRPLSPMMALGYHGADGIIFAPHGDGWRQLRKICALELLGARRVHAFRSVREDEAGRLLRAVAAAASSSSPVNLSEGIAGYVADSTVRAIIGSRFRDRDAYLRLLHEGLKIMPGMTLPDLFPSSRLALLVSTVPGRLRRLGRRMGKVMDNIIKEHHESRIHRQDDQDEDLLDVFLRLQKEVGCQYPLTTQNIKNVMLDIFFRRLRVIGHVPVVRHAHTCESGTRKCPGGHLEVKPPLPCQPSQLSSRTKRPWPLTCSSTRCSRSSSRSHSPSSPPDARLLGAMAPPCCSRRSRGRCRSSATFTTSPARSRTARRHGPLMTLRFGEVPTVVASSADAAREIMKTHDAKFASRPLGRMARLLYQGAEGVIIAPYGDAWRQLRKICTLELLSTRRVQSFRPVRQDELGRLIRSIAEQSSSSSSSRTVNLSKHISAFVADATVRAIIGSRFKDRDGYLRLMREGMERLPGASLPDLFPSSRLAYLVSRMPGWVKRRRVRTRLFMDSIIQEHHESRAHGDDDKDLLDVLLRLQKEADSQFPLTTENIKTANLDISTLLSNHKLMFSSLAFAPVQQPRCTMVYLL